MAKELKSPEKRERIIFQRMVNIGGFLEILHCKLVVAPTFIHHSDVFEG